MTVKATELLIQVKKPLPTAQPIDPHNCPATTKGSENGLVLVLTKRVLYQGVNYAVASVVLNLTEVRLPAWCPHDTELLYQALLKDMFQKYHNLDFGDINIEEMYRGGGDFTVGSGRQRRGVVNDGFMDFNTRTSIINSMDNVELAVLINQLKGQHRKVLGDENAVVGSGLHEEVAMTLHLKEIRAQLETHAKTINALIREDRNASDQAAQNEVCGLYGAWLLGEGRSNLEDLRQGRVPSWISNQHLAALTPL